MATGTAWDPPSVFSYEKTKQKFDGNHIKGAPTKGASTNFDLALNDDSLIDGSWVYISGGKIGDTIKFQVVDVNNVLGYGAGTVLDQFLEWGAPPEANMLISLVYPGKIPGGVFIRVIYASTAEEGDNTPYIIVNFFKHKVLI